MDFLNRIMPSPRQEQGGEGRWTSLSRVLVFGPLILLAAMVAVLGWRTWKRRKTRVLPAEGPVRPLPDITRQDVDAGALPEDGWLAMAREMMGRGESRLALRALYLAILASLARQDLITLAPHKSDREYERELRLHSHVRPRLSPLFAENRVIFERAWYGMHEVTPAIMERFSRNQESIRDDGRE